jgi:CheY-like chemotaxis protein
LSVNGGKQGSRGGYFNNLFCIPLAMNTSFLRVLLAADSAQQTLFFEQYLREAGHEVVAVEARGEAALKAARLIHPDLVVLSGPLRGSLDGIALAAALQTGPTAATPVLLVTDPAELPGLLALQAPFCLRQYDAVRPQDAA